MSDSMSHAQAPSADEQAMLPFASWPPLRTYLRSVRSILSEASKQQAKPILVLGNPSADLDSFVSAIVYSYFHNRKTRQSTNANVNTVYIPLLNLPKTPASELRRLRPEFDQAFQAAAAWQDPQRPSTKPGQADPDLDQVLTIKDLITSYSSNNLSSLFNPSAPPPSTKIPLVLVDHNAPSIPGLTTEQTSSRFDVVGCIDHHVDETYVSQDASPRIIQTQAGSCTSLVVSYLRSEGLFPEPSSKPQDHEEAIALQQISTLSLSSILIDTSNLTSATKTTPIDHEMVSFLTSHIFDPGLHGAEFIHPSGSNAQAASVFISRDYHQLLSDAKANSLNNLTMQEVFDRDYKQFSERHPSPEQAGPTSVEIGISSLVQPISWLTEHAGSPSKFANAISSFTEEYKLDVFMFLTRPTKRGKGLGAVALSDTGEATIKRFEQKASTLGLDIYDEDPELDKAMSEHFGERWRVWYMTRTENTRKQVAPLIRDCVADHVKP